MKTRVNPKIMGWVSPFFFSIYIKSWHSLKQPELKPRQSIPIFILIILILTRSVSGTGLIYGLLDLSISLFAAYVMFIFYDNIKSRISGNLNFGIPAWMIILSYILGGSLLFIDSFLLNDLMQNNKLLGLLIPISFLIMVTGIIWFGMVLIKISRFRLFGVGFIFSIISFLFISILNSENQLVLRIIGQVINAVPYLLILRHFNFEKREK